MAAALVAMALLCASCGDSKSSAGSTTAKPAADAASSESPTSTTTTTTKKKKAPKRDKTTSTTAMEMVCKEGDLENCYTYDQMKEYVEQVLPYIQQFFADSYETPPVPDQVLFVAKGESGTEECVDPDGSKSTYTPSSYEYCPADNNIYIGQDTIWEFYHEAGDAAPVVGLAHEYGHLLQNAAGVPSPEGNLESITHENQADCIAGAWVRYAIEQGWFTEDDANDTDKLLSAIQDKETGQRNHGDLQERTEALLQGINGGLSKCNRFYNGTPIITGNDTDAGDPGTGE